MLSHQASPGLDRQELGCFSSSFWLGMSKRWSSASWVNPARAAPGLSANARSRRMGLASHLALSEPGAGLGANRRAGHAPVPDLGRAQLCPAGAGFQDADSHGIRFTEELSPQYPVQGPVWSVSPEYMLWGSGKAGELVSFQRSSLNRKVGAVTLWGTEGGAGGQVKQARGERATNNCLHVAGRKCNNFL